MLTGKVWQYQWGTRRELVETWHYLQELYPGMLSGKVYGRAKIFGVIEDKTVPEIVKIVEEPPPLLTDYQGGRSTEPGPGEEVRVPLDEDTGEELVSFKVDYFIVHASEGGSMYVKVHGGPVRKYGASAWGEVMEALIDISDMEPGFQFNPPYPVKAFCTTSEKGFPNKVKYFERTQ